MRGQAMTTKQEVQETIFNGSRHEGDGWPPEDPAGFVAWFQERIDRIPAEYRSTATIELDTQSGYYGDSSVSIEITYRRPETDEQFAARLARDEAQKRSRMEQDRDTLAALLAKYGAP